MFEKDYILRYNKKGYILMKEDKKKKENLKIRNKK